MITKERLQELLGENIYIYEIENGNSKIKVCDLSVLNHNNINIDCWLKTSRLFETKEDAEFALRFKRIPRTEYLDLPTWEEFYSEDKLVAFTVYPHNYHILKVGNYIYLRSFYGRGGMDIFNKPLTKENYLEACEICKKLFLGEEV